jgi:hypothetical protein
MKPIRFKQIADNLIKFGIIDAGAIEDAYTYDNYVTQDAVFAFCDTLNEILQEDLEQELKEYARLEADWRMEVSSERRDDLRIKAAKTREAILSSR